jgi:transposase
MVSSNHPVRQLFDVFSWHEIDLKCAAVYKNQNRGAPAYPPQVLFRILVLMFYSGTPFESATLQRLETDIAWRWFAGLGLLRPVPDAGTLSRFRSRLGVELFEAIFVELVKACDEVGLVGHIESYYDMTGMEASAMQATPYQRAVILTKALSVYLDQEQGGIGVISKEQIAAIGLQVLQENHPSLKKVAPAQIISSQERLEDKLGRPDQDKPHWWQRVWQEITALPSRLTETPLSVTDHVRDVARQLVSSLPQAFGNPDAAVGHTRTDGTLCGYKGGFLVDAKRWIITAVIFVAVNKPEAPTVIEALDKHYAIFERYPDKLGLDSAFDRDEVHFYAEQHHIYSGTTVRSRPGPAGVYHSDAFIWDEEGQLRCPNSEVMEHVAGPYKDGKDRYRATGDCTHCPHFKQCLTEKQRQKAEPHRQLVTCTAAHQRAQRNRERSHSPQGRALRKRRFASEGVFGHVNHYHNGDKAPYRSGAMDHIAQLMVAFVSNLEKLATYT